MKECAAMKEPEAPISLTLSLIESSGLFGRVGAPTLFCWVSAVHLPGGLIDDGNALVLSHDITGAWHEHSQRLSAGQSLEVIERLEKLGLPERAPEAEEVLDTSEAWFHISFLVRIGSCHARVDIPMHSSGFEGRDAEPLKELFRCLFGLAGYRGYSTTVYGSA
jgi:hypothetical protein